MVPAVPISWTCTDTMETMEFGSEENVKNEPWNQDYLHGLFDDQRALMDEHILEENVSMKNIDDQLSAGFRALGRLKLGLKPAPKASALGLTAAPKREAIKPEPKRTRSTKSGSNKVTKKKQVMKKNAQKKAKKDTKKKGNVLDEILKKKLHSVSKQHFEFSRKAKLHCQIKMISNQIDFREFF